jgi:multidrug efflux pump subunit AcrA (membrane-fusion protein)
VAQQRSSQPGPTVLDPVLQNATVKVKRELMLPSKDNGALVELAVEKGQTVEEGAILGQIDNTEAVMTETVATAQLQTAEENAGRGSEIQLDYANKAQAVAEHIYLTKRQAWQNRQAVTEMEVKEAELEFQRAEAQTLVRHLEQKLATFEVTAKAAELAAAKEGVARRRLTAPFAGYIEDCYRRKGEWVQAGEPILRLMDFETMIVSGQVDSREYSRRDIDKRPVTVVVELPRGQREELQGVITVVSPITDSINDEFTVEAEVANKKVGNHWLLTHGSRVTMTIHVN